MPTPYNVLWSDEALENVDSIVTYLESRWSQQEADAFIETLQEKETVLSYYPEAYPMSGKSGGYRRCVVTKQITIFYKFENEVVIIHHVFDTRQDPDKLNLEN